MSPKQQLRQLTNVSSGQSTARSMGLSESTVESEILAILDRDGSAHTNQSIKSERTPLPERYHTRLVKSVGNVTKIYLLLSTFPSKRIDILQKVF